MQQYAIQCLVVYNTERQNRHARFSAELNTTSAVLDRYDATNVIVVLW